MGEQVFDDELFVPDEESGGDDLYEHHRFVVDKGQDLLRIDKYLGHKLEKTSRNRIQKAIEAGSVKVNDRVVKSNYRVKPLDVITIVFAHPPHQNLLTPQPMPLDILYEDDSLLIVNKPAGLVVHPGHGNYSGTLVNGLMYHLNNQLPVSTHPMASAEDEIRPGLVHRIDKDTSGVMVIAKNEISMTHLARQFFDRTIDRKYLALVWGNVAEDTGRIEAHIGRDKKDRTGMAVYPGGNEGKPAITNYRVVERLGFVTLVECKLETGRTHQIRVHMRFIGHPLFNDEQYGGKRILKGFDTPKYRQFVENCFSLLPGQALHAATLGFIHPESEKPMFFEAPLPENFRLLLDKWRRYLGSEQLKNKESGPEFS
jgi:23S rRNA pseudouridine1911/1915/1917 synthase